MKRFMIIAVLAAVLTSCTDNIRDNNDQSETIITGDDLSSVEGSILSIMNSMMENVKEIESTGNVDNDFAILMKTHHLATIEMARLQVAKGSNAYVKEIAKKIIKDHQSEVAEFNTFLSGV